MLGLDFVLDRRVAQDIVELDRDFLWRGAAMGADCRDRIVFGGAGGAICGLRDRIAREYLIEAGEAECLPRFEDGPGLFPERGRQRRYRHRLLERLGEILFDVLSISSLRWDLTGMGRVVNTRNDGFLGGLHGFQSVDGFVERRPGRGCASIKSAKVVVGIEAAAGVGWRARGACEKDERGAAGLLAFGGHSSAGHRNGGFRHGIFLRWIG